MTWCFRLRFDLGATAKLDYNDAEWVVRDGSPRVTLCPADEHATVAEARRLALRGNGYATERAAAGAGQQWRDWLILAFACVNVGADFGERAPSGGFTGHGLATASNAAGTQVLNDVQGLMMHECEPRPRFLRMGPIVGMVSCPHEQLAEALDHVIASATNLTSRRRLAYDLYAASFSERNADARFVMLMMALETLVEPRPRPDESQALVDSLIAMTRGSGLTYSDIASIEGTLKGLRMESINRAGHRLASQLDGRTYQEEDPETFFRRCYDLRSSLVHGAHPRPGTAEIGIRAANLKHFVSHLICGSLLDDS